MGLATPSAPFPVTFFSTTKPLVVLCSLGLLGLTACPASSHGSGTSGDGGIALPNDEATLVVGVEADDFGPIVSNVHVVVKQDGVVVHEETTPMPSGSPTPFAKEIPITGKLGARIDVVAEALSPTANEPPVVTRLASGHIVGSGATKKLLRVYLEGRCVVIPPIGSSPALGPTCNAPLTCIGGGCQSGDVGDNDLEDYDPTWGVAPPDICRPAKHGAPDVMIGTGQTDYGTLTDGQTLQLELGPQGGHHIWIAARMKNLRQSGTTTTITSVLVGDPEPVPPVSFVFTFDSDEGSYCKVYGLRYQVDSGTADLLNAYKRFLGKTLAVTVEVKDTTGATARSTRTIQLATKLLCPDGTDTCNAS